MELRGLFAIDTVLLDAGHFWLCPGSDSLSAQLTAVPFVKIDPFHDLAPLAYCFSICALSLANSA